MQAVAVKSQLQQIARPMYSNPPLHGALIVSIILSDPELKGLWLKEVKVCFHYFNFPIIDNSYLWNTRRFTIYLLGHGWSYHRNAYCIAWEPWEVGFASILGAYNKSGERVTIALWFNVLYVHGYVPYHSLGNAGWFCVCCLELPSVIKWIATSHSGNVFMLQLCYLHLL